MIPTFKELADGLIEVYAKRSIRRTPEGEDRIDYHPLSFYCLNKAPELIEALERASKNKERVKKLEADNAHLRDMCKAAGITMSHLVQQREALNTKGSE